METGIPGFIFETIEQRREQDKETEKQMTPLAPKMDWDNQPEAFDDEAYQ